MMHIFVKACLFSSLAASVVEGSTKPRERLVRRRNPGFHGPNYNASRQDHGPSHDSNEGDALRTPPIDSPLTISSTPSPPSPLYDDSTQTPSTINVVYSPATDSPFVESSALPSSPYDVPRFDTASLPAGSPDASYMLPSFSATEALSPTPASPADMETSTFMQTHQGVVTTAQLPGYASISPSANQPSRSWNDSSEIGNAGSGMDDSKHAQDPSDPNHPSADNTDVSPTKTVPIVPTCGMCTVNAQAGLDWWFGYRLYHELASISTSRVNGSSIYRLISPSAPTPFNVTSAMKTNLYDYRWSTWFDPVQNQTVSDYVSTQLPLPAAAATVTLTQSDVLPGPTTTFGIEQLQALNNPSVTDPSIAVPAATGTAFTATYSTNLVYYTSYEVESPTQTVDVSGSLTCITNTATYKVDNPYLYEYDDPNFTLGAQLAASGPVYPDFLSIIPQSTCLPGTWLAPTPTMYVLVEEIYRRGVAILIAHHEVTATGTLTAPTQFEPAPGDNNGYGNGGAPLAGGGSGSGGNGYGPGQAQQQQQGSQITTSSQRPQKPSQGSQPGSTLPGSPVQTVSAIAQVSNRRTTVIVTVTVGQASPTVVVDGNTVVASVISTYQRPGIDRPPVITIGSQQYTPNAAWQYSLGQGQILTPGGVVSVHGEQISLQPDGQFAVVDGYTTRVAAANPRWPSTVVVNGQSRPLLTLTQGPSVVIGGNAYTEHPGAYFIIGDQTLRPGHQIAVGPTVVSLPVGAQNVVVDGVTTQLNDGIVPVIVIGQKTYSTELESPGTFVIAGQTLAPGGSPVTVDGTTVSLQPGTDSIATNPPLLVIGTHTYTANAQTTFDVDGQSLAPGNIITVDGTMVSLAPSATAVVINGRTTALFPAQAGPATVSASTTANPGATTTGPDITSTPVTQPVKQATGSHIGAATMVWTSFVIAAISILAFW